MDYILCLSVDCRFPIRILVIYRHSGFNGGDLGMVDRYPVEDTTLDGLERLILRLDRSPPAKGDMVPMGSVFHLTVPALHLLLDRIEALEERVSDRLDAMDHRIESLVGRSVPATECAPKPLAEPMALHELRAVLQYAAGLDPVRGSSIDGYKGFMECRRLMIRAIELRLQAFD